MTSIIKALKLKINRAPLRKTFETFYCCGSVRCQHCFRRECFSEGSLSVLQSHIACMHIAFKANNQSNQNKYSVSHSSSSIRAFTQFLGLRQTFNPPEHTYMRSLP